MPRKGPRGVPGTDREIDLLGFRRRILGAPALLAAAAGAAWHFTRIPPPDPSIAVLTFADMSPQRDQGYLAEGVAEEIINEEVVACLAYARRAVITTM